MRRATGTGAAAATVALALGLAACGVTQDPAARPIADVPFGLADATTTTTAPPAPPTAAPTTTTTAAPPPASTTTVAPNESVAFYYVTPDGRVRAEYRFVPVGTAGARIGIDATLQQLKAGPQYDRTLANLISDQTVTAVSVDRGRADVWLGDGFLALEPPAQLAAVAQLVLTFTDRPGIGRVVFRTATEAQLVVPRADGTAGAEETTADDYRALTG